LDQVNTSTKILSLAYFITGSAFMVFQNDMTFLPGLIMKSLIIPILMILFIINIKLFANRLNLIMFAGLFFSWAGDVVLEFEGLFIPGLVCFLLAHLMYLIVFFKTPGKNVIFLNRWYLLIPVILSGTGLVFYLYNDLAAMKIPVIIYSIVILTMLTAAINRLEKVNRASYYFVLAGAILFVISDSAIAINKFIHPFESSGIVVMTSYIIAQYLIVSGFIKQSNR